MAEAFFSPGYDCPRAIGRLLAGASKTADICVFAITDDRLADAILDAHRRGVAIRIITDDAKAEDLGALGRVAFMSLDLPVRTGGHLTGPARSAGLCSVRPGGG